MTHLFIIELVFQSENLGRKTAFKKYLIHKIEPLYNNIIKKSDFGEDILVLTSTKIAPKNENMLSEIPAVRKIYEDYVLATSMHQKLPIDTFEKIFVFLKEFELSPQLVYRSIAYAIFVYILRIKEETLKFTFEDFVDFLIRVSEVGSKRILS